MEWIIEDGDTERGVWQIERPKHLMRAMWNGEHRTYHQRDGSSDGVFFNCLCYNQVFAPMRAKNSTFF